ncbi:MAG: hypothetical protein KatS3mg110_4257 [Pirellulaceae bacterium]|nr:MAG: hypothetical protein KatS3mg110_4257 [Pirellulaceae bacterium]
MFVTLYPKSNRCFRWMRTDAIPAARHGLHSTLLVFGYGRRHRGALTAYPKTALGPLIDRPSNRFSDRLLVCLGSSVLFCQ